MRIIESNIFQYTRILIRYVKIRINVHRLYFFYVDLEQTLLQAPQMMMMMNQITLKVNQIYLNKYHFTFSPVWQFKRYEIITGLQYAFGKNDNLFQLVNYSNPVEYNPATDQSLEGIRHNTAQARLDAIALFFGLTKGLND